ncbi:MAG: hypothetical protein ACFUZC_18830 [Chthoniobacteraceae bacterium]
MKLTPLKDYPEPAYPTKEVFVQDPELLRKLPRRWREGGGVLTRMAGFVGVTAMAVLLLSQARTVGAIATPPLFLTEDEARAVIEEEARKAGVEFPEHGRTLRGLDLPVTDPFAFLPSWIHKSTKIPGMTRKPHKKDETELDGWNPKLHIGYKFVYRREFTDWEENDRNRDSNVTVYDAAACVKRTKAEYAKGTDAVAVFYDPMGGRPRKLSHPNAAESKKEIVANASENQPLTNPTPNPYRDYWEKRNADAAKRGNEELRGQVRDFIEWLKDEGVIQ